MKNFKNKYVNIFLQNWLEIDKVLLLMISTLIIFGLVLVSTSSPFVAIRIGVNPGYFIKNHILYLFLGIFLMIFLINMSKKNLINIAFFVSVVSLVLMISIVLLGLEIKGAKRWFYIFGFSIQPSEFVKICFPIVFASIVEFFQFKKYPKNFLYFTLAIYYFLVIFLLLLQPDIGMTLLISIVFVVLLILIGLPLRWVFFLFIFLIIMGVFAYIVFPHVHYRVNSFLFENNSYQVAKSIEAIFRSGLFGQGVFGGNVSEYIPDAHSDFIFAVASEDFGLVFALILICLYCGIGYNIYCYAIKSDNNFKMISVIGMAMILLVQAFIHIASNINLIPTKGMTLPLISYGGSSLISSCIMMGFILCITKKDIQNIFLQLK